MARVDRVERVDRVDRAHFHYPGSYTGEENPAGGAAEWQLLSKEVLESNLVHSSHLLALFLQRKSHWETLGVCVA